MISNIKLTFGDFFRKKRIEQGLTLRAFCRKCGLDTAYISRVETNKIKPPIKKQKSTKLAKFLGLKENTKEWKKFFDLAAVSHRKLPEDIVETSPEVISMLPAFLRTPDGKQIQKKKVLELITFLKNERQKNGKNRDRKTKLLRPE